MLLNKKEQLMLEGKEGKAVKKAMEILVALGKIYSAKRMIRITSAQISGVSYKNLGDEGIDFLKEFLRDIKVKVLTTLNPAGMDLKNWKEFFVPKKFAKKQLKIIKIFENAGIETSCSCVPYLIGNVPKFQEHISWSESSAVIYANSVLGARTNRESGISALCAAITGSTPEYGYHLDKNRKANFLIDVSKVKLKRESDFSALGYLIGKKIQQGVPYLKGIEKRDATLENLKLLGAAMAASGGIALYHIEGITPEAKKFGNKIFSKKIEKVKIESLDEGYKNLNFNSDTKKVDLVSIGCPHASLQELEKISKLLEGKKLKSELWISTSRSIKKIAEKKILLRKIENSGAKVIADTCIIVSPIEKLRFKTMATNSGKMAFYAPSYCNLKVKFGPLEKCIDVAINGVWKS